MHLIEGLKITVSADELRSHLQNKAEFHAEKAAFYGEQVAALRKEVLPSGQSNDPVSSLQGSERQHRAKWAYFSFLASHVIPGEEYLLSERDLEAVEIFQRYL